MSEVSLFRLYVLRATYLLLGAGLGSEIWPLIIHHVKHWDLMHGVANSLLAALPPLWLLGIRYPLQMIPLLLFELLWKLIWLIVIALPLWLAHNIDADTSDTIFACQMGIVIVPLALPWPCVFANYVTRRGDRWR
jgi:hypothetical protein